MKLVEPCCTVSGSGRWASPGEGISALGLGHARVTHTKERRRIETPATTFRTVGGQGRRPRQPNERSEAGAGAPQPEARKPLRNKAKTNACTL